MSVFGDFEYIKTLLESVDCRITLTQEEADKLWEFTSLIQKVVDREMKRRRMRELEEDFLRLHGLLEDNKRKEAFELLKKIDAR